MNVGLAEWRSAGGRIVGKKALVEARRNNMKPLLGKERKSEQESCRAGEAGEVRGMADAASAVVAAVLVVVNDYLHQEQQEAAGKRGC